MPFAVLLLPLALPALPEPEKRLYPAMRHAGAIYVIRADASGHIQRCQPAAPETPEAIVAAACAALTAKGVPGTIVPATPTTSPSGWIKPDDYPIAALRLGRSGSPEIIYEIGVDGRVSDCRTYATSGNRSLDSAACAALTARARFSPARYKGQPATAVAIDTIHFWTP